MNSFAKATLIACTFGLAVTGTAQAASLSWTSYKSSQLATAKADRAAQDTDTEIALEDFEGFRAVPQAGGPGNSTPLGTAVGTFTTTPGTKCGGSCDAPNDESLVRDVSAFGRYNTTDNGAKWLDSNDNAAINLLASASEAFNRISFFLTDIDDVGPTTFSIDVGPETFNVGTDIFNGKRQKNGGLFLVSIELDDLTKNSTFSLRIDDGDGFGIDDVRLSNNVAPIPVPATLPLLAGAIGVMGWARRRRKAA